MSTRRLYIVVKLLSNHNKCCLKKRTKTTQVIYQSMIYVLSNENKMHSRKEHIDKFLAAE